MQRTSSRLRVLVFVPFVILCVIFCADDTPAEKPSKRPKVAAIVTVYHHNSHADMLVTRMFKTYTLDDKGGTPSLDLASLYTDQVPKSDTSRKWSKQYGFPIYDTIEEALTLGTDKLAVDGVMLVAEHGDYPRSESGQKIFPKRRLFGEIVKVFEKTGKVVPVFSDKHLADNWEDAKWFYDTAKRMKIPLIAGSSLPGTWRYPATDVPRKAKLEQLVAFSYGGFDSYGFHGLEMVQSLVARRKGGETGVRSVRCLSGDDVWTAEKDGIYDGAIFDATIKCLQHPPPADKPLKELVRDPALFIVDYNDGLRVNMFHLNGAFREFAAGWKTADGKVDATLFWLQDARPYNHFEHFLRGIEPLMHTGKPPWPVERTLLVSGTLDALLISRRDSGKVLKTPYLDVSYQTKWNWKQPPPPPPNRPSRSQ